MIFYLLFRIKIILFSKNPYFSILPPVLRLVEGFSAFAVHFCELGVAFFSKNATMARLEQKLIPVNSSEVERKPLWVEVTKEQKKANAHADHSETPEVKAV